MELLPNFEIHLDTRISKEVSRITNVFSYEHKPKIKEYFKQDFIMALLLLCDDYLSYGDKQSIEQKEIKDWVDFVLLLSFFDQLDEKAQQKIMSRAEAMYTKIYEYWFAPEAVEGRKRFGDPGTLVNFYNDLRARKENAADEFLVPFFSGELGDCFSDKIEPINIKDWKSELYQVCNSIDVKWDINENLYQNIKGLAVVKEYRIIGFLEELFNQLASKDILKKHDKKNWQKVFSPNPYPGVRWRTINTNGEPINGAKKGLFDLIWILTKTKLNKQQIKLYFDPDFKLTSNHNKVDGKRHDGLVEKMIRRAKTIASQKILSNH